MEGAGLVLIAIIKTNFVFTGLTHHRIYADYTPAGMILWVKHTGCRLCLRYTGCRYKSIITANLEPI